VRGLLVVNPRATTTSPRIIDVIVSAFSGALDLEVTVTTHKGHGIQLGERARVDALDLVITLGGDGVVNEVTNGMLADGPGPDVPLLATVPGGSANVFARSLGLPNDPVEATGLILECLRGGRSRPISVGRANERWFLANAGVGIDAEIIAAMERHRRSGRTATPTRYLTTTLMTYFRGTDRKTASIRLSRPAAHGGAEETVEGVHLAFVQNTSPWTYFGNLPINPLPETTLEGGLDVFALRSMGVPTALVAAQRMVRGSTRGGDARGGILSWHDQDAFRLTADHPVAFQIDGEGIGEVTAVQFTTARGALRVIA
jgi:diacylglycerol kinase family enzyme